MVMFFKYNIMQKKPALTACHHLNFPALIGRQFHHQIGKP